MHHEGDEDHDEDEREGHAQAFRVPRHVHNSWKRLKCHGLETVYFANFAGAKSLNVNVTTLKGPDASADDA